MDIPDSGVDSAVGLDSAEQLDSDTVGLADSRPGFDSAPLPDTITEFDTWTPPEIVEIGQPVIRLNEVGCHGGDFLELVNLADSTDGDLEGWVLADGTGAGHRYVLPAGTLIAARGRLVVGEGSDIAPGFSFGIRCGEDTISLFSPEGQLMDKVGLPLVPEASTVGRLPDGTGDWTETLRTPGRANEPPLDQGSLLFDPGQVVTLELTLSESGQAAIWDDPYEYVEGTFSMQSDEVDQAPIPVGLRLKGRLGSFRDLDHKSGFKVKFNWLDKDDRFLGIRKLTLNNMVQDSSMIHEVLAYTIFRAFGVPAPRTGYAWVRLNGLDYGLYLVVETIDDVLLDRYYPSTGHLYEGGYGQDLTPDNEWDFEADEGLEGNRDDLVRLIQVANETPDEEFVQGMREVSDLDEMLRMWAVEQYIGHWDGYAPTINNYFLHSNEAGVFTMLPWGTDQTFSDFRDLHKGKGLLFSRCMAISDCRQLYDQTLADLLPLLPGLDLVALAQDTAAGIQAAMELDPRKECGVDSVAAHQEATREFLADRYEALEEFYQCVMHPELMDEDQDGYVCRDDCDEGNPQVHIFADDICGDGIDQDCNGLADDGPECPDCREVYRGPHRYLFCYKPRIREEARAVCEENGSKMVTLLEPLEHEWVRARVEERGWSAGWIGANDLSSEGTWVWETGEPVAFETWSDGEPNDWGAGEDCCQMFSWGGWNDISCQDSYPVVCEDQCSPGQDDDQDGYLRCDNDCDDGDPALHPGAVEICGDGIDQDCSGKADDALHCIQGTQFQVPGVSGPGFYLVTEPHPRQTGRDFCHTLGNNGELAYFASLEENELTAAQVQTLAPGAELWFGLNDLEQEGIYVWPDQTEAAFTNWTPGQPNNSGNQDCARMLANGKWNDTACDLLYGFLCRL